ncbi:hypothetical protein [Motilimonas pumila]|uniref:Uncharacterized protein n=1 Tax=Motilimonas pumila TaxID=2303987 RepID=A0A418Y9B2_9GAMM|nr:hypothetical protein [Motilimonas pumila]RJG36917.1 hypothetical protein D1Z90_20095 [Motilimonas pumila]
MMLKPAKKPIQQTVILCLVTLLFTLQKHGGFMLGFVLLLLAPSFLKSLYFIFVKNREREQRSIQTFLWVVSCSVVVIHHIHLHKTTQDFAEQVSSAVVTYYQQNGFYPDSAEALDFDKQALTHHGLYYSHKNGAPLLWYRATWIVYDIYMFNFNDNSWCYQAN